uniref:Uncharacterized protein n=1 Tax=Peronospora matthiolae TaxID=2874970 RepID=A0AAV1VIQ1_9STRA
MLAEKLQMLQDYVMFIHGKMSSDITLVKVLAIAFSGENKLASFIAKAKLNSDAKSAAEILEKLLIGKWLHKDMQPELLLELLEMDASLEALINPMLDTVMKYIAVFNLKHGGSNFLVLPRFKKRDSIEAVAKMLVPLSQAASDESLNGDRIRVLQSQLLQNWLDDGNPIGDFFELLLNSDKQAAERAAAVKLLDVLLDYS